MPCRQPQGGDMTLAVAGLVTWLKDELGAVSGN